MEKITLEKAKEILKKHTTEEHLFKHALAVSAAMGQMAEYFVEDKEEWEAVGYLHDVDFEKFPTEHCHHVKELLEPEGIDKIYIDAIISHGYGSCTTEVEPVTNMQKSLFTVDELTGIVMTTALMRPTGITDMEVKSVKKKYKDLKFAAGCNRDVINHGLEMLNLPLETVVERCILGMRKYQNELNIGVKQ